MLPFWHPTFTHRGRTVVHFPAKIPGMPGACWRHQRRVVPSAGGVSWMDLGRVSSGWERTISPIHDHPDWSGRSVPRFRGSVRFPGMFQGTAGMALVDWREELFPGGPLITAERVFDDLRRIRPGYAAKTAGHVGGCGRSDARRRAPSFGSVPRYRL